MSKSWKASWVMVMNVIDYNDCNSKEPVVKLSKRLMYKAISEKHVTLYVQVE